MKSASIGVLLSVVSLAGVGVLYLKMEDLSDQIRPLTKGRAESRRDFAGVEETVRREPPARIAAEAGNSHARKDDTSSGEPSRKELLDRVAELEKRQKELAKRPRMPGFKMPRMARSVKDLASNLELNETQEARIQDAVDRAKRRIEDVLKIPDDTGVSPFERRKRVRDKMQEAMKTQNWGDIAKLSMDSRQATLKTIPGQNVTYRDEVDRIKKETRDEINSNLTPEQQKDFGETRIDPLLGEAGGHSFMAFSGDLGGSVGEVVIESAVDVTTSDKSPEPEKEPK